MEHSNIAYKRVEMMFSLSEHGSQAYHDPAIVKFIRFDSLFEVSDEEFHKLKRK